MTIYVDDPMMHITGKFRGYCHMWSAANDLAELHAFAQRIGLRREWFQMTHGVSGDFPHYDISRNKRNEALLAGAEYLPLIAWIQTRMKAHPTKDTGGI